MTGGKQWAFAILMITAGAASRAYAADMPDDLELTIDVLRSGEALDGETVNRIRLPEAILQAPSVPGDAAHPSKGEPPAQEDSPYGSQPYRYGDEPGGASGGDGSGSRWEPPPPPQYPTPPERPTRPGG
jgi:hypothetical protein